MVSALRAHLLDSVRLRLKADVPVGIYLSGGIDSSALAGIANHLVREEGVKMGSLQPEQAICCFSIAFDQESGFDESGECWQQIRSSLAAYLDVAGGSDPPDPPSLSMCGQAGGLGLRLRLKGSEWQPLDTMSACFRVSR